MWTIDAAKAMRLYHESPEVSLKELSLPFLDARKRVAHYPEVDHTVQLIAVPTTSGTGSEVSPAAVVSSEGAKVTLVDYSLVPDVAIIDPTLTLSMPPGVTADTGVDALTHALELGLPLQQVLDDPSLDPVRGLPGFDGLRGRFTTADDGEGSGI